MNFRIPIVPLPEDLTISTVLTEDEKPKPFVKTLPPKTGKPEQGGGAFHEKSEKNKKVNVVVTKAERMKKKYGKPKTRGAKRK